jgi:hypothetical protein
MKEKMILQFVSNRTENKPENHSANEDKLFQSYHQKYQTNAKLKFLGRNDRRLSFHKQEL